MAEGENLPESDATRVYAQGRTTIPAKHKEFISANQGSMVSWKAIEENGERYLKVKKVVLGIAIAALLSVSLFPNVIAQNATIAEPIPVTEEPVPETPPVVVVQPQITTDSLRVFKVSKYADGARLPLRIELTYPTGQNATQDITFASPGTKYLVSTSVGFPNDGLSTTTWSTEYVDTFNVILGQIYRVPVQQVATAQIFSNGTLIDQLEFPLDGDEFAVHFFLVTSPKPSFPTAEELSRPVTERLDRNFEILLQISTSIREIAPTLVLAANAFRFSIIPNVVMIIIGAAMMFTVTLVYRKMQGKSLTTMKITAIAEDKKK